MVNLIPGKDEKNIVIFSMTYAQLPNKVFQKILLELEAFVF